jgi:hypothetical protein
MWVTLLALQYFFHIFCEVRTLSKQLSTEYIIIIITMARASSCLLFPRLLSRVHSWQLVTDKLAALLCVRQSHLAGSQETWVRNGFSLRNIFIHARKVPLHGTDGFISPPKEVVLRIFITLKSNPRTLGPVASMLTTSPPRSTQAVITLL